MLNIPCQIKSYLKDLCNVTRVNHYEHSYEVLHSASERLSCVLKIPLEVTVPEPELPSTPNSVLPSVPRLMAVLSCTTILIIAVTKYN